MLARPCLMQRVDRLLSALGLGVAAHVHRDALADMEAGPDTINRLLHLAVAAVAPFDGVGGRRQQGIVQESQGLLQVGREQLLECLPQAAKAADALAQAGQFGQGGLGPAAAVEEAIDLLDDLTQRSLLRLAARCFAEKFIPIVKFHKIFPMDFSPPPAKVIAKVSFTIYVDVFLSPHPRL